MHPLRIRGRRLHPVLVLAPLSALTTAFAADVVGTLLDAPELWIAAWYLSIAGVVAGLVAAVPGARDWLRAVPPGGGRVRATLHGLVNGLALMLFAAAWFVRGATEIPPDPAILLIEGVAVSLLVAGAWLGRSVSARQRTAPAPGPRLPRPLPGR